MRILFFIPLLLASARANEVRSWTDHQDRQIEATLLRVEDQTVILKLKDGREVPYPLAKLSAVDGAYVEASRTKTPGEAASTLNFDVPWPEIVKFSEDPEITTVEEDAEKKRFVYESSNYRFVCDVRLSKSLVKGFAVLFEATRVYCRALPLAFDGGTKTDGKYQILLYEQLEGYVAAGGPPGSAGVFIGRKNAVLVPLTSLGVRPVGSGYMLDRDKSSSTIPHELTHQLSPRAYFAAGAVGWFSEGIAEYVATTPYRGGTFNVRGNHKAIVEYVTAYGDKEMGGRALGKEIGMPLLKSFMLQDYASFQEDAQLGYGCGLLLTHYFFHMDGAGDGKRVKAFLKALRDGKEGEEALNVLLDGRSFEQLQEEITKAWGRKGVDFTFGKS